MINVETDPLYRETFGFVDEAFLAQGFDTKRLYDFRLPEYRTEIDGKAVMGHTVHGDLENAETVVMVGAKFLTPHLSPHYQMLLQAYQTVLGNEYCVVGCDQYPNDGQTASSGIVDGSAFSEKTVELISALGLTDDQNLILYGYSMGADIAIKTAHDMRYQESMGIRRVDGLWAAEFVRSKKRSPVAVLGDFNRSGKGMAEQIAESRVLALTEAWGGDPSDPEDPSKLTLAGDLAVLKGAAKYFTANSGQNFRVYKGFGRSDSVDYLDRLGNEIPGAPSTAISRYAGSSLCDGEEFSRLSSLPAINGYQAEGNHVRIDNIRHAASLLLYIANRQRIVAEESVS